MPAEAVIQAVGDSNNFKDLDSRFRGNDTTFPIATQSLEGEGRAGGNINKFVYIDYLLLAFCSKNLRRSQREKRS